MPKHGIIFKSLTSIILASSAINAQAIINGNYDKNNIYDGVVNMGYYYDSLNGYFSSCTATLIAPKVILTAAHCIFDHQNDVSKIQINLSGSTRLFKKGLEIEKVEYYPSYMPGFAFMGGDVGLIILKEEVQNTHIYKINSQDNQNQTAKNETISLVGYGTRSPIVGVDTNDQLLHFVMTALLNKKKTLVELNQGEDLGLNEQEKKLLGNMQFDLMLNNGGRYYKDKLVDDISSEFIRMDGGEGINQGDSGGPWFQTINGEKYIAAVSSTVSSELITENNPYSKLDETNKYTEKSLGQKISNKHLCWIDSVAQTNLATGIDCEALKAKMSKQTKNGSTEIQVDGAVFNDPEISEHMLKHYDMLTKHYLNREFFQVGKKSDWSFEFSEFDPDLPGTQITIYMQGEVYAKVNAKIQRTNKDGSADYLAESRDKKIQLTFKTKGKLTLLQKVFDNHRKLDIYLKSKESDKFIKVKTKYIGSVY